MSSPAPSQLLSDRIEALSRAADLGRSRLDTDSLAAADAVVAKARDRLRHGSTHCVVALVGPTGSGKSSILNALVGAEVSTSGVRRPTTSETHAVTWNDDASDLLDWLRVRRRHHITGSDRFAGLVLLDLPDFDSTEATNQVEVDRLIELVDVLIWVVEPQKYADQALHAGYLRPLSGHGEIMRFVLSKSDTLSPDQLALASADFASMLNDDGIAGAGVTPVSVSTGQGLDDLRTVVAQAVSERRAMVDRLSADITRAATTLSSNTSSATASAGLSKRSRRELLDGLGRAAGIDEAAAVVARQYRRDAAIATGWPPTRWLRRIRRAPIRDLPTPSQSAVATAEIGASLRSVGDEIAADLPAPWDTSIRRQILDQADPVRSALAQVNVAAMRDLRDRPRWWQTARWLQHSVGLIAAAGAIWLIVLAVVGGLLRLDTDAMTPMAWDWMPLPTLLLLGGAVAGLALAAASRGIAVIGGKRRGHRAAALWRELIAVVADQHVVAPTTVALGEFSEFRSLVSRAAGPAG